MSVIRCPHCGEVFTIDESEYESIARQIRDHEFEKEMQDREKILQEQKDAEIRLIRAETENRLEEERRKKEAELSELKHRRDLLEKDYAARLSETLNEREKEFEGVLKEKGDALTSLSHEMAVLKEQLAGFEAAKESTLREMAAQKEKEAAKETICG